MHPPWFKLLKQWQDSHRFGLTVPFIYGALENWPGAPLGTDSCPEEKFTRMLRSIADGASDRTVIRLFTCGTVQDLTFAPVFEAPCFCAAINSSTGYPPTLWVQKDLLQDGQNTCEALASVLWARYSVVINEGRYSFQAGAFALFTDADLKLIQLAVARNDEDA
jgi:hypothetical protein